MSSMRGWGRRVLMTIPLAVALPAVLLAPPVQAQDSARPIYAVRVMPVPYAQNMEMSGDGHIAGIVATVPVDPHSGEAFVWSAADGMTFLDPPAGGSVYLTVHQVNDNGWVVGSVQSTVTGATRALIWRPVDDGYELFELGHAPGKGDSQPVGIDSMNRVVGSARTYPGELFATPFLWSEAAGMQNMVDLGYLNDPPKAISDNGWVATGTNAYRLGEPSDVAPLPEVPDPYSGAYTVKIANDGDRFVSLSRLSAGKVWIMLARLDAATTTWKLLWPADMPASQPSGLSDVNARGDAVGFRFWTADVSWAPGEPVEPLTSFVADGYDGVPGDLYPGVQIESGRGLSNDRDVVGTALFGNNGGRLVRLVSGEACTAPTCLRVEEITIRAKNPTTCEPGATIKVTSTATVRDQDGAVVAGARVGAALFSQYSELSQFDRTNAKGIARFVVSLGACEGTVTTLIESVKLTGAQLDRSAGVLVRNVIPST